MKEERGGETMQIQRWRKDIFEGLCDLFCKIEGKILCQQFLCQQYQGEGLDGGRTPFLDSLASGVSVGRNPMTMGPHSDNQDA